jgi:hypothetical protein
MAALASFRIDEDRTQVSRAMILGNPSFATGDLLNNSRLIRSRFYLDPAAGSFTARALPRHSSICPRTGFKALTAAGAAKPQMSLGTSKRTLSGKACASSPNNTSATRAKVDTSRVNQPQVSKLGDKSKVSSKLMRPWLGRMPTKPQWLAGARTEPPVSEPRAKSHMRLDTAEAEVARWAEFDYLLVSRSREEDLRLLQSIYETECARSSRQTFRWASDPPTPSRS